MKIQEMKPSEFDAKYAKHQNKLNKEGQSSSKKLVDDIPESEKWRIIKESGILDKMKKKDEPADSTDYSQPPPDDFIFDAIIYTIPFTSLYVMMDNLVQKQYGEESSLHYTAWTFVRMFPALLLLIYLSNRFRTNRFSKMSMFLVGISCGVKLMTLMRGRPILLDMKKAPGLAVLWTYTVFQLDFVPCLISVVIPAVFYFYQSK
ncbi:hypothetical protein DSO57_1022855 [Entomophthora muscae]|uniref:Uncharacterized protein n=1 Tax=Entomophthora muscae TaxID=34485 RepID=A0ACC2RU19_9FUNG|nr:hypothetical protein DSO57_1022855 [Entomophthora muscae]